MNLLDAIWNLPIYGLEKSEKEAIILEHLNYLTALHQEHCPAYASILRAFSWGEERVNTLEEVPYIPVRLFKEYDLKSIESEEIVKILTSSGTTSTQVSRIALDRQTATYQSKALVKILQEYLGHQRLPMLIIDHPNVIRDPQNFSARGAGIVGISNFGRNHTYLLNEEMEIDLSVLESFLETHKGQNILLFGFTFMVWQYFYQALEKANITINIPNATLIHSGGWKKLHEQAVDNKTFKQCLRDRTSLGKIYNFYGMVEQVGSIFMEGEDGYLHTPLFADIIVRDPWNWKPLPYGQKGVIEVFSILPYSYPGHALLTEDLGIIWGEDDSPSGQKGKYFTVEGRIPRSEVRGCSDTHIPIIKN
ncbi:LuxE/PaaK family acyltransferase [Nostoc sp.]|uniref:LuxE/PaaK family acyltransferase n=1 Tax=Nostoc sp. TaxID=1180 RepID=UPI002FFA4D07